MTDVTIDQSDKGRIEWALFLLRLGVFIVFFAWTVDKFVDPDHATKVFEHFYFLSGFGGAIMMGLAIIELVIIFAFLLGLWKRYTYGFIMIFHGVSTFSAWKFYIIDIQLLFFAAWPMLAACVTLYLLRDRDVKFTVRKNES